MKNLRLLKGHVLDVWNVLAPKSVNCIVTSPPYWMKRQYDLAKPRIWPQCGGPCIHEWEQLWSGKSQTNELNGMGRVVSEGRRDCRHSTEVAPHIDMGQWCAKCESWRGNFGHEPSVGMYVEHTLEVFERFGVVLKDDGVIFYNVGDGRAGSGNYWRHTQDRKRFKATSALLIPERISVALSDAGWCIVSNMIWYKDPPKPESVTKRPTDAYEHIIVVAKSNKHKWNRGAIATPYADATIKMLAAKYDKKYPGMKGPLVLLLSPPMARRAKAEFMHQKPLVANAHSVQRWGTTSSQRNEHYAMFPNDLPEWCIKAATDPGDTVFDPFAGSGTTGAMALKLRRKAVLMDLAYQDKQLEKCRPYPNFVHFGLLTEEEKALNDRFNS